MTDKYYTIRLFDFLRKVAANNNRDWFHSRKSEYDELRAQWLEELDRLVNLMAAWEPQLVSQSAKTCAYRFYRDTRFSQDKSPYKTFFSAAISPWGRKTPRAGYYLHMGIDEENLWGGSGLYGGIWCPDAQMLRKLRHAIVDNIEEFEEIINAPDLQKHYPGWIGESLKKVPAGWDKDHPQAGLLKLKEYGRLCSCKERFFSDPSWVEIAAQRFSILKPLIDFLNYSLDE
ncbi:MAG: DUF2461 domain-containing protein [Muribaculaceae bacterium]|nr:DUF2461 domain-containing protein [Muribaculaceae bacterium]